ncbi:cyclic nucleotide-binding protein [Siphonobacter sp. BAB-5385]|uniref:Crp/Fnr family transcriptional regulator n=1 Tax=unclassified Siphonobacter TaxID=2635712 RepID=UPI000B9E20FD|nr:MULTISPECIES: Crp/Fnr family transcriptional regulator [unclassified Siphonobacter]OZI07662.1 cyclic nucleotide-binding protein [Siphonobacter sp. BAB-5385]PMD90393.1 cyclic nucleotide-binding protein [Siphonobacter sp. BAB-5405]
MFEVLFAHIQEKVKLTPEEKEVLQSFFVVKKLRKRQYLLQEGQVCTHLSFVVKGLLRSYNVDEKGHEHINLFAWEGWWVSDLGSFLKGEAAILNIDALENSELLMISLNDYEALMTSIPKMERYFRLLYQNSLVTKDRRLISSITHTAEEKYWQLAENFPQMIQRVPQHLIASYLGLAPETISRIRKNRMIRSQD